MHLTSIVVDSSKSVIPNLDPKPYLRSPGLAMFLGNSYMYALISQSSLEAQVPINVLKY